MDRRDFLNKLGISSAALAIGSTSPTLFAREQDKLSLVAAKGDLTETIPYVFKKLGGIDQFIKPGNSVLLKPNIAFAVPSDWSSVTQPDFIRSVAEQALKAGAKEVIVGEHTNHAPEKCFKQTGIGDALKDMPNVHLMALNSEDLYTEVTVPDGKAFQNVKIAKVAQEADVIINLPCAKVHATTGITFGIKNLMGLIWDRRYFHNQTDLESAIAELALLIRPTLTILDARNVLTTNGPKGPGKLENLQTIIASPHPIAVDVYATILTQWDNRALKPKDIKHLVHAAELGLGDLELKDVKVMD